MFLKSVSLFNSMGGLEIVSWAVMIAALIGTWLNIKKNRRCFYIWAGTNTFWMVYDSWHGLYAQVALFTIYLILSLIGLWKWKQDNLSKPEKGACLDNIGELLGITRNKGERDKAYRERLKNTILMEDEKIPYNMELLTKEEHCEAHRR